MVNPDPLRFEPELEALLQEIARDPRSTLLRIERPPSPIDLVDSWEAISRWTPGLTVAERHLLDVYRADTAQFLRERWLHEVTVRPQTGFSISRTSTLRPSDDVRSVQPTAADIEKLPDDVQESLGRCPEVLEVDRGLTALQLSTLVVTAERLVPSVVGKTYLAYDQTLRCEPRSAAVLLRRLLEHERGRRLRSHLWEALGFAAAAAHDLHLAARSFARSIDFEEPRFNPLAVWFVLSVQVGNKENALSAASRLDDLVKEDHPFLLRFRAEQLRTRREGAWAPTPVSQELLPKIHETVGNASRRVLDVLASKPQC